MYLIYLFQCLRYKVPVQRPGTLNFEDTWLTGLAGDVQRCGPVPEAAGSSTVGSSEMSLANLQFIRCHQQFGI